MNEMIPIHTRYWVVSRTDGAGRTECDTCVDANEAWGEALSRIAEPRCVGVKIEGYVSGEDDGAEPKEIPGSRWVFDAASPEGRREDATR